MSKKLEDLLHVIRLIENGKIDCCTETYLELRNLYDWLEEEERPCHKEKLTYEDKYEV